MIAHSTKPIFNDLKDGDEVILQKGFHDQEFKVVTLRGSDRAFTGAVASDGTVFEFKSSGGYDGLFEAPGGQRWSLYFSYPLPKKSDEDRIAYGRAMRGDAAPFPRQSCSEWDNTVTFFVESVADGSVTARMLSHDNGYMHKDEDGVDRLSYKSLDDEEVRACAVLAGPMWVSTSAIELDPAGLPSVTVGNVIVGTNLDVKYVDGRPLTTLRNPALLPGITTLDKASELFPIRESFDDRRSPFAALNKRVVLEPIAHWEYHKEVAHHALDADEALVVVFPDPDNPGGSSEHIGILTSRGAVFYADTGYAHDQISGHGDLMPGVVHITEVSPWGYSTYEGEHDAGIDFADAPADETTLAHFGLDIAGLGELIRGFMDEEDEQFNGLDDRQLGELMMSFNRVAQEAKASAQTLPAT